MNRIGLASGLIVLFLFSFYVGAFYPGYMSWDSACHYQQLESGKWTTYQPVVILLLWKVTDAIIKGPGGFFLFFLSIYLFSLWLLSRFVQGGWIRRVLILLSALLPVNVMLFPHIWKDIGLLVFTLLSIGFLVVFFDTHRRLILLASLVSLWIGVLFRFEAILYLWPLVFFQMQQWRNKVLAGMSVLHKRGCFIRNMLFVGIFVALALSGNKLLVEMNHSHKVTLWPTVALWDIARVSVREGRQLLPPFAGGAGVTVEQLSQSTHNWTNTSLFSIIRSGLGKPYTAEQYRKLFKQWVSLPFTYPSSYAKHRLRLGCDLLRLVETPNKPQSLFWINGICKYGERFPANRSELNEKVNQFLTTQKDNIYFKPWFYLLIATIVFVYILSQSRINSQQYLALYLIISSFLSVVVMSFLAPAAEQRYLIILFNFIPLSACLSWKVLDKPVLS